MNTLQKATLFIENHDRFVLTTHEGADADGIGAELVLLHVLEGLGKQVMVLNADQIPERFAFLDRRGTVQRWDAAKHADAVDGADMIVLDTSDELNLGIIAEELLPRCRDALIIDHHEPSPLTKLSGYVDTDSASTCELILRIAEHYRIPLDADMASIAYAGILYDTGSFIYPKTSERTFAAALSLVRAGAVPHEIYRAMFESSTVGALLLQKRVLATLELHSGDRVALQSLSREDLRSCGAAYEDAESFINIPLKSKDIEVSILVKENSDGQVRCSLRSKGKVNVSTIAQSFGGGGHRTAAGFRSRRGLAETKAEVLQKVITALA